MDLAADHAASEKGVFGSSPTAGARYSDKSAISTIVGVPLYF